MKYKSDFAVFILSHGRPDNVKTYETLKNQGYTGRIILLCDTQDEKLQNYIDNFPEVYFFDKNEYRQYVDDGDNFGNVNAVVYARNYNFALAKNLGIKYFLMLDDDYKSFVYCFNSKGEFERKPIKNLDKIFEIYVNFLLDSDFESIAFIQSGDLIGGQENEMIKKHKPKRKIMNAFFFRTDRPVEFLGKINEDVNTYVTLGRQGKKYLSPPDVLLYQETTQKADGGLTDVYLQMGTYVKSFYSVMYCPSAVKIGVLGDKYKRIHHNISWDNVTPCILNERYKK